MESSVPAGLKTTLEEMVSEYIFSADILNPPQPTNSKAPSGLSTKELVALLAPLRSDDATMSGTSDPLPRLHLPVIFSIALKALQQRQLARPDPDTVEAVYRALLLAVIQLDFSIPSGITQEGCNNITALLEVMTSADVALPLTALVEIVVHAANLNHSPTDVRWDIVEQVLRNDFDAFLHPSSNLLKLDLFSTITAASPSDQIFRVIELLIEGFAKARDLLGFVEHWKGGLPAAIWSSNSVKKSFAKRIETSLIPTQIERLVKQLGKEKHWDILDATLRGVHKEETEARLRSEGTLPEIVASASAEKDVCPWRVIVRIADIDRSAISGTMGQARKLLKKMGAENEDVGLLAAEVILKSATIPDPENLDAVQTVLEIGAKGWKNSHKGFALNLSVAVTGPFLSVLEAVDAETRNRYVDCLLEAAISAPASQVRKVWDSMVRNPVFFELLALKGWRPSTQHAMENTD